MKKIVIKMRSMKKLFGNDLLQLVLLLSLMKKNLKQPSIEHPHPLFIQRKEPFPPTGNHSHPRPGPVLYELLSKVDPENYLGYSPHSPLEPGGDIGMGPTWAQTQAMFHDLGLADGMSHRLHPKSMDSLLELHQAEILEDLNSLGRYSRLSQYGGHPVHISAYIVDTNNADTPGQCEDQDGNESDSGISDTNHDSDQESMDDSEKEKDCDVDMECETILDQVAAPAEVLGLEAIVGLTPPPEAEADQDMLAYSAGQDALEAELVHIDEQLMHIEDDLGHIDEQFIMMDQQLAETISEDSIYDADPMFNTGMAAAANVNPLDPIDIGQSNPFDDWQRETYANMDDLVLDNIDPNVINVPRSSLEDVKEDVADVKIEREQQEETILQDQDLFPTDQSLPGSALLEDFDEDLFGSAHSKISSRSDMGRIVKQDVVLPQMPSQTTNSSQPSKSAGSASLLEDSADAVQLDDNTDTDVISSKESSVDRDFMEEINVEVDQDDEDIIMQVLRESNINFNDIPIDIEDLKVEEEIKLEDIKEEVIEVEDIGYEVSIVDGATAKTEIDYDKLHTDIKAKFQETDDGFAFAELTLGSQFSDTYNPGFNSRAFENDHSYGIAPKLEPTVLLDSEPSTSRRRNISESSGYSSIADTEDLAASSRSESAVSSVRCRDEMKARKMKLPFQVADIINSPVDSFNEMLTRPGLTADQIKLCHDIRRRGKNKVAARNCRKRKMDTIEELQNQVDQVRRRREELLRAREQLEAERARWSSKLSYIEETVLAGIGKELGMFTLEVTGSEVKVVTQRMAMVGGAGAGRYTDQERGGRSAN